MKNRILSESNESQGIFRRKIEKSQKYRGSGRIFCERSEISDRLLIRFSNYLHRRFGETLVGKMCPFISAGRVNDMGDVVFDVHVYDCDTSLPLMEEFENFLEQRKISLSKRQKERYMRHFLKYHESVKQLRDSLDPVDIVKFEWEEAVRKRPIFWGLGGADKVFEKLDRETYAKCKAGTRSTRMQIFRKKGEGSGSSHRYHIRLFWEDPVIFEKCLGMWHLKNESFGETYVENKKANVHKYGRFFHLRREQGIRHANLSDGLAKEKLIQMGYNPDKIVVRHIYRLIKFEGRCE
jgi:hypothetical protein